MTQIRIRRATPDDTTLISEMAERTFREAYSPDNDPDDMDAYIEASFNPEQIGSELGDPAAIFLLAHQGEEPIGYAKLYGGVAPEAVIGPEPVELVRIYVESGLTGAGYGSIIMEACLEEAGRAGYQTMWLGVWKRNERAVRFYKRWGFNIVGKKEFLVGNDLQRDHVMARLVETPSSKEQSTHLEEE